MTEEVKEAKKQNCQKCGREFLIIPQEQEFLAKMKLPLPSDCPHCRQKERLEGRGERKLYRTRCQKCQKEIIITYNPKTVKSPILCKKCYLEFFEKERILLTK